MCSAVLRAAIPTCPGSASQPHPLLLHILGILDQHSQPLDEINVTIPVQGKHSRGSL